MQIRLCAIVMCALTLISCGGGGNGSGGSSSSQQVITSRAGDATVTATLKQGVIQLPNDALTALDDSTLIAATPLAAVTTGTVITWRDRPYVITAISAGNGGAKYIVRLAQFSEALSDLKVEGDIDISAIDTSRMSVLVSDGSTQPSSASDKSTLKTLTVPFKSGPCSAEIGSKPTREASSASCTLSVDYADFRFALNVGVRNAVFTGVNLSAATSTLSVSGVSTTPFVRATASLLTDKKQSVNIAKSDIPIVYVQLPIAYTLGFLRMDIPVRLDVSLPLFKFQVGSEVSFPYSNGKWSMNASIDTPVATMATDTLFKYDATGRIYGIVGTELVLGMLPVFKPSFYSFEGNSPDRLLSLGFFFKGGWDGNLSIEVQDLKSKPCFKWSLQAKGGVASDVRLVNNPIEALNKESLQSFGAPTSGGNDCDDLGPSPGGFSNINLACKRDASGSAIVTGLYAAELLPGEQITVVAWSSEYFTGFTQPVICSSPTYDFPDKRQFGIPGEYLGSDCVPIDGLNLHPVYYATCHNSLAGQPRNIWIKVNSGVSGALSAGGSVIVQFCRATTANLNGTVPQASRPQVSLEQTIACK